MEDKYHIKIRFNTKAELDELQLLVNDFKKQNHLTYKNEAYKMMLVNGYENLKKDKNNPNEKEKLIDQRLKLIEAEVRTMFYALAHQFKWKINELEEIDVTQLPILQTIIKAVSDDE